MNSINTRDDFVEYIMKTLGHPVITVNVTEDQVEYRIDDALLKFFEFHNEGSYRYYYLYQLTQEDINNGYITLPERVLSVICIYPTDGLFSVSNNNNLALTSMMQNIGSSFYSGGGYGAYGSAGGGIFPSGTFTSGTTSSAQNRYTMSNVMYSSSYLGTITGTVNGYHQFQYVRHGNKLIIDDRSLGKKAGDGILIELYMEVDDENHPVWNSIWLREYTVALVQRQWGMNLIKFGDTQLANGTTINGDRILQEANQRVKELEDELQTTWSEPLGVYMF